MSPMLRTRLAPTPSGYLHLGNLVNFQLVDWLARDGAGTVVLRIDDADAARARPEYLADIFEALAWLGIAWQEGPRDAQDFAEHFSQQARTEEYRAALAQVPGLYACTCSRREVAHCRCRAAGIEFSPGETALRLHIPAGTAATESGVKIDLAREFDGVVLWRRDDLPAYHLVTVVEDERLDITHAVRGVDLLPSSALHRHLAALLGARSVPEFRHHGLVAGADGAKLSKSAGGAAPPVRTEALRREVAALAAELGAPLGIGP